MTDREAFEAWWKQMKPAECDEVEPYFVECWQAALATAPKWLPAPDAPGLWLCEDRLGHYSVTVDAYKIQVWNPEAKYYGPIPPIPEDKP